LHIQGNTILRAEREGISLEGVTFVVVEENAVGECGGPGMRLFETLNDPIVRSNTVFRNGGSGIEVRRANYPVTVEKNIGSENIGWGLVALESQEIHLGCNDWFGNTLGAIAGVVPGASDLNVEPSFCNLASADVTLNSASPLVGWTGCGQIGAFGVGCGVTATLVQRFTAGRSSDGIRLVWKVAAGATASEIWLERSQGSSEGPWIRPITERSIDNGAVMELDQGAASDRTYWYRLVAQEGSLTMVIGGPIQVEAQALLEFRLVEVGPNPASGPVRIAFALKHGAAIEIDVFDVQGRRVASPGSGVWPAGTNEVVWDGRTRNGQPTPAGLYVIRYLYPGGQDRRGIVRMQ
jgi:hypothetical protein